MGSERDGVTLSSVEDGGAKVAVRRSVIDLVSRGIGTVKE